MSKPKPAYRKTPAAIAPRDTEYVSKEIAAKRLGLSVRRVLELSARGAIKRRQVVDPGTKRRQTVFRSADVQAVVDGQQRLVVYRGGAGEVATVPPVQPVPSAPSPDCAWLTVDEAAAYSGLPGSFLLGLITGRRLAALDVGVRAGGRFRLHKCDIDKIEARLLPRL